MIPQEATPKSVREAVMAAAQRGEISMLQGNARMPVTKASELATRIMIEQKIENVGLRIDGPWIHITPFGH